MNDATTTVVTATKWASIISHVKANRIEYLVLVAILHMAGLIDKAYGHVSGVCL
jgi:hypothetical protein